MRILISPLRILLLFVLGITTIAAQTGQVPVVTELTLADQAPASRNHYWLQVGTDVQGQPIVIPAIVLKGSTPGPVLGLTAALHGNELNGIAVLQELSNILRPEQLSGTIVAIPGANPLGIQSSQREFTDGEDLNRVFPGRAEGNRSQQMAAGLAKAVLPPLDFLVDLHTASFGRENAIYARADMDSDTLALMALSLGPDIVLHSSGEATAGSRTGGTLRGLAMEQGIQSITLELADPQVFQQDVIDRAVVGLENLLHALAMLPGQPATMPTPVRCSRSFWLYADEGGYLVVLPEIGQRVAKNEVVAYLRNPFGERIREYRAPEAGVVIGKSTNPAGINGARTIHLGIPEESRD